MGAVVPPVPPGPVLAFRVDEPVEVHIGPGRRIWRPGTVLKVTRTRVTVEYSIQRGLVKRRTTVVLNRVRPRREAPAPAGEAR
jgi:hypothetical protein